MKRRLMIAAALLVATCAGHTTAAPVPAEAEGSREQRDERMAWWREAKFGLFIHWGVYAVPAGTYNGKNVSGIGEWIMRRAKIPVADYRAFATQFNPLKYDPDAWAGLAEAAGMKYIVITSKHHDGFALFPSEATDWDIADATPYGKDLIGPLAAAARRRGLKFGLYYSQAQDWTHPGGAKSGFKDGEGWDAPHKGSFDTYLTTVAVPQVREILTRYQPDILWWDTPHLMTAERAALLEPLLELRPGIITNNRLGGGCRGDTDTPEQHIPATGMPGRDWETCMTMNRTWGYKSYDHDWKSTETLTRNLIDIVSKGGNYLLNIGPTAEGEIPPPSIERLKQVGAWMRANGQAIYGTTASPFRKLSWGRCTKKLSVDGATLYLHVFDWPENGELLVPGLRNTVRSAALLADGTKLVAQSTDAGIAVQIPAQVPDSIATVVVLEVAGKLDIERVSLKQAQDGSVRLPAVAAQIHNVAGSTTKVEEKYGEPSVGFWLDARAWIDWRFRIDRPGLFTVVLNLAAPHEGSGFRVIVADNTLAARAPNTGGYEAFKEVSLGAVRLYAAGEYDLAIRPEPKRWKPVNVRAVLLKPVE